MTYIKKGGNGGKRTGAGRPKGSKNKIKLTAEEKKQVLENRKTQKQ